MNEERFDLYDSKQLAETGDSRSIYVIAIAIGLITFAVYTRSLFNGFVYDATVQIASDEYIHTPSNLVDVVTFRVMARDVLDFNRPVHLFFLMIDSLISGYKPLGFHFTSNLFHSGCAVLLFLVLFDWIEQLLREKKWEDPIPTARTAAIFGSLAFALHPACVESVAEPSFREDPLVSFFTLLALYFATRLRAGAKRKLFFSIALPISCLLAVGSKETGVVAPLAVVVYFLAFRTWKDRSSWLIPAIAGCAVVGLFVVARFALAPEHSVVFVRKPARLENWFSAQCTIWRSYFRIYAWPVDLSAAYDGYFSELGTIGGIVVVCIVAAMHVGFAFFSRIALMSLVLFWGGLLPASNIMPQYIPMAERYLNTPAIGLGIFIAAIFVLIWRQKALLMTFGTLATAGCIGLAVATIIRQGVFKNDFALWEDTVRVNPRSAVAWDNLGYAQIDAGQVKEALNTLQIAHRLSPGNADIVVGAAICFELQTNHPAADHWFEETIKRDPAFADPDEQVRRQNMSKHQAQQIKPIATRYRDKRKFF